LPFAPVAAVGGILLVTGAATLVLVRGRRLLPAVVAPAVGFALAYLVTAFLVYPAADARKSARPLALRMAEVSAASRAAGHPVLAFSTGNLPEPLAFYSDGVYTWETSDLELLERHLLQQAEVYAVVSARDVERLSAAARERMTIVERYELGKPIWLVSNVRAD
ncbi:MAG TPA: hypothetical protein VD788_12750, partial [Candidatus Polarisedimenticolaceae bacterium]|nr:hypothetical protein [Candidatus Polarisedimenticolaceae bacterium]